MSFQSSVNIYTALGIPGELAFSGPNRTAPYILDSDGQAQTCGFAFTERTASNPDTVGGSPLPPTAQVGGTGVFAGLLVNPKEYPLTGTTGAPLGATLDLPDNVNASLLKMGFMYVSLPAAANIGDLVLYSTTTGALSTVAPSSSFTGVVATNTLTVSGFVSGGAPLGIGTVISGTGVTPGTVISALGTGTGGNGTYTVTGAATVSSTTMAGNAIAPSGTRFVPNCVVDKFTVAAAGVACVRITN